METTGKHWTGCAYAIQRMQRAGERALAGKQVDSIFWGKGKRMFYVDGQKVDAEGLKAQAEAYLTSSPSYEQVRMPRIITQYDAEDITAKVLLNALSGGKLFLHIMEAEVAGRTWFGVFYRYLINGARNYYKHSSSRAFPAPDDVLVAIMDSFQKVEDGMAVYELLDVLKKGMPAEHYALVVEVLKGYTMAQVATGQKVGLRTVERAWRRAKDLLNG